MSSLSLVMIRIILFNSIGNLEQDQLFQININKVHGSAIKIRLEIKVSDEKNVNKSLTALLQSLRE